MPAVGAVWLRAGCGCSCPVVEFGLGGSRVSRMCLDRSPWLFHRDVGTYTRVGWLLWRVLDIKSKLARAHMYV